MNKLLLFITLLAGFLLFSCSSNSNTISSNARNTGSAKVTISLGQVGALAKMRTVADIELANLSISLTAPGQDTITDALPLSGNSATTIVKTYAGLASNMTWTLIAKSIDARDSVIHWGSTTFQVQPNDTANVSLSLAALYSMLKANFFPIRDSVTSCQVLVNSAVVADSSFAKESLLGDTVQLAYDYLTAGISQKITLNVYGVMWGSDTLLYTGDTVITPISGVNASYNLTLNWMGPSTPPPGKATINVVLGAIGTVTANGQIGLPVGINMISIPAGSFQMGSNNMKLEEFFTYGDERPVHSVTVSAFYMDSTPVTQASYQALMGVNPSYFDTGASAPRRPAESMTWYDAVLYCNARSKHDGYDTVYSYTSITGTPGNGCSNLGNLTMDFAQHGYRLPTEAEYEYACRAGTTTDYYWGQSYPPLTTADTAEISAHAWWNYNSLNSTQPVATKPKNAWGLYDMSGNVREWCNDWYGSYSDTSQTNPTGATSGSYRVLRGDAWNVYQIDDYLDSKYKLDGAPTSSSTGPGLCAAFRDGYIPSDPDGWDDYVGFRCVQR